MTPVLRSRPQYQALACGHWFYSTSGRRTGTELILNHVRSLLLAQDSSADSLLVAGSHPLITCQQAALRVRHVKWKSFLTCLTASGHRFLCNLTFPLASELISSLGMSLVLCESASVSCPVPVLVSSPFPHALYEGASDGGYCSSGPIFSSGLQQGNPNILCITSVKRLLSKVSISLFFFFNIFLLISQR